MLLVPHPRTRCRVQGCGVSGPPPPHGFSLSPPVGPQPVRSQLLASREVRPAALPRVQTSGGPQSPLLRPSSPPSNGPGTLVEGHPILCVQVCFRPLRSMPPACVSVLTSAPCCADDCSSVVSSEIGKCGSSSFVLFQDYF